MKKSKVDSAILIVLIAGIFWSFGALVVRFIEDAQSVPWQYLFFRGFTIFLLINFYLFLNFFRLSITTETLSALSGCPCPVLWSKYVSVVIIPVFI